MAEETTLTDISPESPAPTDIVGVSGAVIHNGQLQTNEKDGRLVGRAKYKTFGENLVNVTIVGAATRYFLNLVAKARWTAVAADVPDGEEKADLVIEMMGDMITPWRRVVRRSAMAKFHGFSISEWVGKIRDDGIFAMADVAPRPQITIERWDADEQGRLFGVVQRSPLTSKEIWIPRSKLIYVVDDAINDSPEGLGLFRHLAEPVRQLQRFEQLEAYGYEADLRGIPIGKVPLALINEQVKTKKLSPAKANEMVAVMSTFLNDHIKNPDLGLMIGSETYQNEDGSPSNVPQWGIDLLKSGSTSAGDMNTAIVRKNREIARLLGVEQLMLGDGGGSFALSKDKTAAFLLTVNSAIEELVEVYTSDWLGPIWRLNGWDDASKPELKTDIVQMRDAEEMARVISELARAGAVLASNDPAIDEVRAAGGMSAAPEQGDDMDMALIADDPVPDAEDPAAMDELDGDKGVK